MASIDGKKSNRWKVMSPSTMRVSEGCVDDPPGNPGMVNRNNLGVEGRKNDPRARGPSEKAETKYVTSRKEY